MDETIKQLKQLDIKAEGLVLVAKGDRYEIYDDRKLGKAIIWVVIGKKKKDPSLTKVIKVEIPRPKRRLTWKIIEFICESLRTYSTLIPFVLQNQSLMKLSEFFYRYKTRSKASLREYVSTVSKLCEYAGKSPDQLVDGCMDDEGLPDPKKIHELIMLIDDFLGELEANDLAPATLSVTFSRIKSFFKVNGIELGLANKYGFRVKCRDRAPTPEEVQRLIEVADLREKAMIAVLATSGMRIGTLVKLKYKHVKDDLEAGRVPLHIHVEAEITKGKYADYDTFLNEEAVHYLKLYLEHRRRGTSDIPSERITDESPLFRTYEKEVRPLTYYAARKAIRKAFKRAGLDRKNGKMHEIRVHSLRKFFRTQMAALGVPSDYIEYMMGHKLSTYHDVQMKGIEFLRNVYAAANLRIFQKQKVTLADILKEIIRSRGEDPSKYLKEQIMAGRTIPSEEEETEIYARAIWEMLRKEQMKSIMRTEEKALLTKYFLCHSHYGSETLAREIRDIALILAKELSNALKHELGSK